jgi:hypothetical protein
MMLENEESQPLVGKWRVDPADREAISEYGDVLLDFLPNGGLTYTIHTEGTRQIVLLTYRVEGDVLITDQPSDSREERTRFEIRSDGKLVLLYEHRPSTYVRAEKTSFPVSPTLSLS